MTVGVFSNVVPAAFLLDVLDAGNLIGPPAIEGGAVGQAVPALAPQSLQGHGELEAGRVELLQVGDLVSDPEISSGAIGYQPPAEEPFPPIADVLGWFRKWILDLDSLDPGTLPPYDTVSGGDYFLVWDDDAREYKGWTLQDAQIWINRQHEDKYNPHDTMKWTGRWRSGVQYTAQDVVTDGTWLMIANKGTVDRPAPQPSAPPESAVPDAPLWATQGYLGVTWSGHEYTFTQGGWLREIQVWAPSLSASTNYRILVVDNTDPTEPVLTPIEEPVLTEGGWTTVSLGSRALPAGTVLLVILDALDSGTGTDWQHEWTFEGPSNAGSPVAGEWNNRTQQDLVRIHYTDGGGDDRFAELNTIIPGSTIRASNVANINQFWEYTVNTVTDTGTTFEFGVDLVATGALGGVPDGAPSLVFAGIPTPQFTEYVELTNYWPTNQPAWATVEGRLRLGGVDQTVPDHAYGTRIVFETAYISPDWDWLAGGE